MESTHIQAIKLFFNSVKLLRSLNIVRSDVILGDIGEYLCSMVYPGLILVDERTNVGFDALYKEKKVQIKYSNSSDSKNVMLGKTNTDYDILIVILGKNSAHRLDADPNDDYLFYYYSKNEVETHFKTSAGYTLSKTKHFKKSDKQYTL